jgi:A/G-specific adenine glycosylase
VALWSGLGYYRRAENLKKTARILTARHGGRLPDDVRKLRALPGIGDYTAGAILSIAFRKPHPAVDGNARRVLARVFLLSGESEIREAARRLVSQTIPGRFNQSLMELGSVLCTPKNPRCEQCPVAGVCSTYRYGVRPATRPLKKVGQMRSVTWPLAIVRCRGRLLLRRRIAKGILAGLWEFPGGETVSPRSLQTLLEGPLAGVRHSSARALGDLSHAITNRRIRAPVYLIDLAPAAKTRFHRPRWRWVSSAALDRYPTSSMTRKALQLLSTYEKSHP